MSYILQVSLLTEDEDVIDFEIVPTVSYEQGAEAVARIVSHHEARKAKVANQLQDEDE